MPRTTPADSDDSGPRFSSPAIGRKKVTAAFNGGRLTSDGGVPLVRAGARGIAYVGLGARRPDLPEAYSVGDHIRATSKAVSGHTRLPRFVWGKPGVIAASCGTYPLPDTVATGNARTLGRSTPSGSRAPTCGAGG